MRRVVSGLLICALTLLSLLSCGEKNRTYDEGEVLAAARTLLPAAEALNEIYYGDGIRPDTERTEEKKGVYYPALAEDLARYSLSTVDELKERTRATFSASFSSLLFSTKLSSVSDGESITSFSRFYQAYEGKGEDKKPTFFMVNSETKGLLTDKLTYDYGNLSVEGAEGQTVYVTLSVVAENEKGERATVSLRVGLMEEADGWRIDTPTYARYPINR